MFCLRAAEAACLIGTQTGIVLACYSRLDKRQVTPGLNGVAQATVKSRQLQQKLMQQRFQSKSCLFKQVSSRVTLATGAGGAGAR